MWTVWMAWLVAGALADEGRPASVGEVLIPLTPSEGVEEYVGLFEVKDAAGTWVTEQTGFECHGVSNYVEVVTRVDIWPSEIPKKVICVEQDGKRKVKARVRIDSSVTHRAMIVSDGTLVMPRRHKAAALYEGPVPDPSVVVQRGKTGSLSIHCNVEPGPVLSVTVEPESKDGVGLCTLRTKDGDFVRMPIKIVTANYR